MYQRETVGDTRRQTMMWISHRSVISFYVCTWRWDTLPRFLIRELTACNREVRFLPWQKFSSSKGSERGKNHREEKTHRVESTKDDVRRININVTVPFSHHPSAPFQSRRRDSMIEFSLFLLFFPSSFPASYVFVGYERYSRNILTPFCW